MPFTRQTMTKMISKGTSNAIMKRQHWI